MDLMTESPEWRQLAELRRQWRGRRVDEELAADPARVQRYAIEAAGLYVDFSRQRIDDEIVEALIAVARRRDLAGAVEDLWRGRHVNNTEDQPALHMALRAEPGDGIGDADIEAQVRADRAAMRELVEAVRGGHWRAPNGARFRHVIHVGIGGSHLGPELMLDALDDGRRSGLQVHFASATDPTSFNRLRQLVDPDTCLLVVTSKSFGTRETLLNAGLLVDWLAESSSRETVLTEQLIGVSANADAMTEFGIPEAHQLTVPDWVGGRYSVWSAVGVTIALRLGWDQFAEVLAGARAMDRHFRGTEPHQNLGWLMGLVGIWNVNFFEVPLHGVIPYAEGLRLLPDYLQQLEMESNGKRVDRDGNEVNYRTAPVIWGGVGQNGQHAFFQQLHQGTGWAPLDFVITGGGPIEDSPQRRLLLANALAQAESLTHGRKEEAVRRELGDALGLLPFKQLTGNRPSTVILMDQLDAFRLGSLLALYEHKVYVQSVIWHLNPFDQFGVELGKQVSREIEAGLRDGELAGRHDASTRALFKRLLGK